jgi:hypothetical protein
LVFLSEDGAMTKIREVSASELVPVNDPKTTMRFNAEELSIMWNALFGLDIPNTHIRLKRKLLGRIDSAQARVRRRTFLVLPSETEERRGK